MYNYVIQLHPEVPARDLGTWTELSHIPLPPEKADRIIRERRRRSRATAERARGFVAVYLAALAARPD